MVVPTTRPQRLAPQMRTSSGTTESAVCSTGASTSSTLRLLMSLQRRPALARTDRLQLKQNGERSMLIDQPSSAWAAEASELFRLALMQAQSHFKFTKKW